MERLTHTLGVFGRVVAEGPSMDPQHRWRPSVAVMTDTYALGSCRYFVYIEHLAQPGTYYHGMFFADRDAAYANWRARIRQYPED